MQEHQREQSVDLRVVDQRGQLPRQSDRFGREIHVAGVALVEHEVQNAHHGAHVARTRAELRRETGPAHRALGATDALRHRGLRHEVRLRDLAGREAADPRRVNATADDDDRSGCAHRK